MTHAEPRGTLGPMSDAVTSSQVEGVKTMTITPPAGAPTEPDEHQQATWGLGRVAAIVTASITTLVAIAAIVAGTVVIVLDQTQRDASGYLMTGSTAYSTDTYALVSDSYRAGTAGDWFVSRDLLGTILIRTRSSRRVFVGIAPATAVSSYLANVAHAEATQFEARNADFRPQPGGPPSTPPTTQRFWVASANGAGAQTLTWKVRNGNWRIVLMNADGTGNVATDLSMGARLPHLLTIGIVLLGGGFLILLLSGGTLYLALRRTQ